MNTDLFWRHHENRKWIFYVKKYCVMSMIDIHLGKNACNLRLFSHNFFRKLCLLPIDLREHSSFSDNFFFKKRKSALTQKRNWCGNNMPEILCISGKTLAGWKS